MLSSLEAQGGKWIFVESKKFNLPSIASCAFFCQKHSTGISPDAAYIFL
jgi:hypothetical protein